MPSFWGHISQLNPDGATQGSYVKVRIHDTTAKHSTHAQALALGVFETTAGKLKGILTLLRCRTEISDLHECFVMLNKDVTSLSANVEEQRMKNLVYSDSCSKGSCSSSSSFSNNLK